MNVPIPLCSLVFRSGTHMGRARGVFCYLLTAALFALAAVPCLGAQETADLDSYKWRFTAMWWYSHASGSFRAESDQVSFDLVKDFRFGSYSTFTGGADWHFKRKHHLLFNVSPVIAPGQVRSVATSHFGV